MDEKQVVQDARTDKKAYIGPMLEKRDQLVDVIEGTLIVSGAIG